MQQMFVSDIYSSENTNMYFGTQISIDENVSVLSKDGRTHSHWEAKKEFVVAKGVGYVDQADIFITDSQGHWMYGKVLNAYEPD